MSVVNLRLIKVGLLTYALGILVSIGLEYLIINNIGFYETHRYLVLTINTAIALASVILIVIATNDVTGIKGVISFLGCLLILASEVAGFMLGLSNYVGYLYGVNMPIDLIILPIPTVNISRIEFIILALIITGILGWLMLLLTLFTFIKGKLNVIGLLIYTASILILYAYSLGISHIVSMPINYTTILYPLVVLAVISTAGSALTIIQH